MTGKSKGMTIDSIIGSLGAKSLSVELKKNSRGAVAVVSGVVSVSEFLEDRVELLSHAGRVHIVGEKLGISALENHSVEIYGRILEVKLSYGRS